MTDNYITGANGFIGTHLLKRLAGQDNICLPYQNIGLTQMYPCKRCFFLSTYGNMAFHDDANKMIAANVLDMLECLYETTGTFVYVSSSSVNLDVQTAYSRCKRSAEELLLIDHKKPVIIVRPYSVTGIGEQPAHLIPRLIDCAFTGEVMPFCPEPTHDFIDVEDVVDAMLLVSDEGKSGIYEVGTGNSVSNQIVKEMVEYITGSKIKTTTFPARSYDNRDWRSRSSLIRSLGWVPKKSLADSIEAMVHDYRMTISPHA